jgi:uncharacterized membrane protein (DUF485 family)
MAGNDPTETGGLFIGRRPGTAPLRYRETPTVAGAKRRRVDAVLAAAILFVEALLLATLWGPQPAGWLWIGSQLFHATGSVSFGILIAFVGMLTTIFATIALAMRLDRAWKLVRRASGHEQKKGALERMFVISMVIAGSAFFFWFLVIHGPGPDLSSTQG